VAHHDSKNFFLRLLASAALASVLAGCGSMPKTPELLIQNAKDGGVFSKKDSYEVKRPISQVTAVLKDRSSACLRKQLSTSYWQGGLKHTHTEVLTPKVAVGRDKTRLTVQMKDISPNVIVVGDPPPDGFYQMVVDAYPADKGTTRIETYFQSGHDGMFTAVKPWVTGASDGCPDLTQ
jgi:hypothetical protein